MSLLSTIVKITNQRYTSGFLGSSVEENFADANEIPCCSAFMTMKGSSVNFELIDEIDVDLLINISFDDTFRTFDRSNLDGEIDDGAGYIGCIQVDELLSPVGVFITMNLPIRMFNQLSSWQEKQIKFESENYLVNNPTEKQNRYVAVIRKVHFEPI